MFSDIYKINFKRIVKSAAEDNIRDDFIVDGITVNIVRTRRKKTMAVNVRGGSVSVIVPQHTRLSHIKAVVREKSSWIQQKLLQQQNQIPKVLRGYVEGEVFLHLGEERRLKLITGAANSIQMDDTDIIVSSNKTQSPASVKNRLKKWYQSGAQLHLAKRTRHFAAILEVKPRLVNTRTYSARWGCCSNRKEITYNWQIIMAPENIIDYLVVHELCHIKEHNHSRQFWNHVESVLPDYKDSKLYLDKNGQQYQL